MRRPFALPLVLVLGAAGASAGIIPGGGEPADDCLAEFDVAGAAGPPIVECTDCDPTCDRDGVSSPNGSCTFDVELCLNQDLAGCAPGPLDRVHPSPRTSLLVPALDSKVCGPAVARRVATRGLGLKPGHETLRVSASTSERPRRRDRNLLRLVCNPRPAGEACPSTEAHPPCAARSPLRNLYFGDLHVHTTLSFDAHAFEVRNTPADAYRFARGETVSLPPLDASGQGTRTLQIDRPLDFAAVTDHSEYLGEIELCSTPGSAAYDAPTCQAYRGEVYNAVRIFGVGLVPAAPMRFADICGADGLGCLPAAGQVWQRVIDAAEAAYDRTPACTFTSFVGYEYTAATGVSTLHRNVIFRNEHVPFPTTYFEQPTPQGLWRELATTCLDAGTGCDALVIPHNSNESNGKMFRVEYPGAATLDEERTQAAFRGVIEPLIEVYQHKGDSECTNGLSGAAGAPDEQCDFEKDFAHPIIDCGDGTGTGGAAHGGCRSRLDYARSVLLAGLAEQQRLGQNPYPLGMIASTDTHNGTPGAVAEDRFVGHRGIDDDTPAKQLGPGVLTIGGIVFGPGGIVGAWAEENTRASLFDALRRREVFGTSGPRIAVRFFGGWDLPVNLCHDSRMLETAYDRGVPMGRVLPSRRPGTSVPRFLVSALRDSGTPTRPGTQLERVQIVKGWLEGSTPREQVFDVAGTAGGATVDPATCTTSGAGADSLCTVWTDPAFDPAEQAFYYVRVLENPTCRWSTFTCNALDPADRPPACTDPTVPKTIQERAWTSPIWYRPG
jgi:hypothetical protein